MYHYTGPRRAVCTAVTGPGARVCFSLFFVGRRRLLLLPLLPYGDRRIVVTVFSRRQPRRPSHDAHRRRIITAYARVEKALAGCR